VVGLWKKKEAIILLLCWIGFLLLISNPYWLPLPGVGLADTASVLLSLFFPGSVVAGYGVAILWKFLGKRWGKTNFALGLLAGFAILLAARDMLMIVEPEIILVNEGDLAAMEWIKDNTPKGAKFLANPYSWDWAPDFVAGSDAGWWIPLFAGRQNTIPPMTYGSERHAESDYSLQVLALAKAAFSPTSEESLSLLQEKSVTHIYIGARGGPMKPGELLDDPHYHLLYHQGGAWIFKILYDMS